MTGLGIGVHSEQELLLLKSISKGNYKFSELSLEGQAMLYNSAIDISPYVEDEEIEQFEKQWFGAPQMEDADRGRAIVRRLTALLPKRLQ